VIQRVTRASVTVDGVVAGGIGRGLLVLLGVGRGDDEAAGRWLADKLLKLRVFEDAEGRMNRTVSDAGGGILVVSQFTLYGDILKGNRPGFDAAAAPETAEPLYEKMVCYLRAVSPVPVETGRFRASMEVSLVNDGPVTFLLERQGSGAFSGASGGNMEDERFQRGLDTVRRIDAGNAGRLEEALKDIAPDLYRYIIGFAFGDVISRPGLDLKTRETVTVSALSAMGNAQPQLRVHLNAALDVGCTRAEIVEILMQIAVYAGIPASLNALSLAKEVFAERDAKGRA